MPYLDILANKNNMESFSVTDDLRLQEKILLAYEYHHKSCLSISKSMASRNIVIFTFQTRYSDVHNMGTLIDSKLLLVGVCVFSSMIVQFLDLDCLLINKLALIPIVRSQTTIEEG